MSWRSVPSRSFAGAPPRVRRDRAEQLRLAGGDRLRARVAQLRGDLSRSAAQLLPGQPGASTRRAERAARRSAPAPPASRAA